MILSCNFMCPFINYKSHSLQGPSASAYVTYSKPEIALRTIQFLTNKQLDGRTLKASLGTTKYCSHFLKGSVCTKQVQYTFCI